jgi:hypothetical protein
MNGIAIDCRAASTARPSIAPHPTRTVRHLARIDLRIASAPSCAPRLHRLAHLTGTDLHTSPAWTFTAAQLRLRLRARTRAQCEDA